MPLNSIAAASRCFPEASQCLDGRFSEYWDGNGGLPVFGLPVTAEENKTKRDMGQTYLTQWLERNRFERHPENVAPYDVLLGRLSDDPLRQQGRDWQTFPKAAPNAAHSFAQTGHAIAHEPFWRYWSSHGLELGDRGVSERESLALFGLPILVPQLETNASGDTVLTQWFEREHGAKGVLPGLLGSEVRASAHPNPSPLRSTSLSPPGSPSPSSSVPPSFNGCDDDDGAKNAPNFPVRIERVDKEREMVYLQNVSNATVDLTGWRMCSFRGGQEHRGMGGTIAPGQTTELPNTGGNICNNDSADGSHDNTSGQTAS